MKFKKPNLSDKQIAKNKERFLAIFHEQITPNFEGAEKLLNWIEQSDFFTAPASSKFHMSCEGGLVQHSLNVYDRLLKLIAFEYGTPDGNDKNKDLFYEKELEVTLPEIALIALCHDLCKAYSYTVEQRNVKVKDVWVKEPFYQYNPRLEMGTQGSKSLFIIQNFIKGLTIPVCAAVTYYNGVGSGGDKDYQTLRMMEEYPIVMLTHFASLGSICLTARREREEINYG